MCPSGILTPLRRLRWKLTLSYTLATVAAVLALELLGLCALIVVFSTPSVQMQLVQDATGTLAEGVQPFLSATPTDQAGLQFWLKQSMPPQGTSKTVPDIDVDADLATAGRQTTLTAGKDDRVVVLGASGEVLAANVEFSATSAGPGAPFIDPQAPGQSQEMIDRALRGEPMTARLKNGTILAARPIVGEEGQVLGVAYVRIVSMSLLVPELLSGVLGLIAGSALVLTIGAGIVGTFFGYLVARGLVRRLGALTHATEAWGRGDFALTVHDTSVDEIGQLSRHLNLMAEEIQNLLQTRQELATLEERNRLARDLHDSVKQQLFATTMTLGAAESLWERDPEAAREQVAQALALCRQAQQELSGLLYELRPVALEDKGLATALREYAARWSGQTGIEANVALQGEQSLRSEVEEALFRVAQEALANAARHSQAKRVQVALSYPAGAVLLEVTDDGRGLVAPPPAGRGMGLRSMRERVEALGGELMVISKPGEGTCVTARCQLEPAPGGGDRS